MENLNEIKEGLHLEFEGAAPGVVNEIWSQTRNDMGDVVEARLRIKHSDGMESYHTYRRDGRSIYDPAHDIVTAIG